MARTALRAVEAKHLTLLPSPPVDIWQSEEADVEAVAFMDETAEAMDELIAAELLRDTPSLRVVNLAGRVAYRAGLARAEVLRLRGGDAA
jgi:hypothetical protein